MNPHELTGAWITAKVDAEYDFHDLSTHQTRKIRITKDRSYAVYAVINGVSGARAVLVDFEAGKAMPFPLDEKYFDYHLE